eukprot:161000-Rhodomonas_salina.2
MASGVGRGRRLSRPRGAARAARSGRRAAWGQGASPECAPPLRSPQRPSCSAQTRPVPPQSAVISTSAPPQFQAAQPQKTGAERASTRADLRGEEVVLLAQEVIADERQHCGAPALAHRARQALEHQHEVAVLLRARLEVPGHEGKVAVEAQGGRFGHTQHSLGDGAAGRVGAALIEEKRVQQPPRALAHDVARRRVEVRPGREGEEAVQDVAPVLEARRERVRRALGPPQSTSALGCVQGWEIGMRTWGMQRPSSHAGACSSRVTSWHSGCCSLAAGRRERWDSSMFRSRTVQYSRPLRLAAASSVPESSRK